MMNASRFATREMRQNSNKQTSRQISSMYYLVPAHLVATIPDCAELAKTLLDPDCYWETLVR